MDEKNKRKENFVEFMDKFMKEKLMIKILKGVHKWKEVKVYTEEWNNNKINGKETC